METRLYEKETNTPPTLLSGVWHSLPFTFMV